MILITLQASFYEAGDEPACFVISQHFNRLIQRLQTANCSGTQLNIMNYAGIHREQNEINLQVALPVLINLVMKSHFCMRIVTLRLK